MVGGVLAILLAAAGLAAYRVWNRPLGPQLGVPGSEGLPSPSVDATPSADNQPRTRPLCGGPEIMQLMVVGNDNEYGDYNSNAAFADVIRIARINFVEPSASILSIPRDLWVPIPGMEEAAGVSVNRLKTAYAYGNRYLGPGGGPALLAQTLWEHFGIRLDHYIVINFATFVAGIDAIGGIDIYLEEPLDYGSSAWGNLPAGWNHLDGEAALIFARARPNNSSDSNRIDRQTILIRAIQQKAISPQILPSVPRLIRALTGMALTDLSPSDLSTLLCIAQRIPSENIRTVDLSSTLYVTELDDLGYERLLPDYEGIADFVRHFQAGEVDVPPSN
jgi:LCP family protein required for cell wall assembly